MDTTERDRAEKDQHREAGPEKRENRPSSRVRHERQLGLRAPALPPRPQPQLPPPGCTSLTGTVLAVGEDVLQPLLQFICPFPLQVQLPLEVLELWGGQGERWGLRPSRATGGGRHSGRGRAGSPPHHTAALPFFSRMRCPSTVSFTSCVIQKEWLALPGWLQALCSLPAPLLQAGGASGDRGGSSHLLQVADGLQVRVTLLLGLLELIQNSLELLFLVL